MKTTVAGWFVAGTLLVGLLAAPPASARKDDQAEVLIVQFHRRPVDRGYSSELRLVRFEGPASPAPYRDDVKFLTPTDWSPDGTSVQAVLTRKDGMNQFDLVSVAGGSVRVLKTPLPTDPRNASRLTVLAGMPWWVWCKLHPRECK